jgi:hypothetical protein
MATLLTKALQLFIMPPLQVSSLLPAAMAHISAIIDFESHENLGRTSHGSGQDVNRIPAKAGANPSQKKAPRCLIHGMFFSQARIKRQGR